MRFVLFLITMTNKEINNWMIDKKVMCHLKYSIIVDLNIRPTTAPPEKTAVKTP